MNARITVALLMLFHADTARAETAALRYSPPVAEAAKALRVAQAYDCRRKYCKAMQSCAEACYKLLSCGHKGLDRDKDRIPCENVCDKPCN